MSLSEDAILDQLKSVKYPGFSRDIVSFGLIKGLNIDGGRIGLRLAVTTADKEIPKQLRREVTAALKAVEGVEAVDAVIDVTEPTQAAMGAGSNQPTQQSIDGVQHVVAVASGKGGVGKSTVAANLALALAREGANVGLCDCDLYGPSVALMFGTSERPFASQDETRIIPIEAQGLKLMSMGFLTDDDTPAILRGPMVTRYTQQFLRSVEWGQLDFLILDLPPGTGDIQLTIVQTVALAGAIIVTTPQEVALIDARKASAMFSKVNVEVLGIVENMSYFLCPDNGQRYAIFGEGGGAREAERLGVPLLAQVPLEMEVRHSGDAGKPMVLSHPESESAQAFAAAASKIYSGLRQC
ncbi:MAG: Mrp/NBP35 family ATP-binding protein [Verrucomicrobiota bacterium]